jgi:hypothetical protein
MIIGSTMPAWGPKVGILAAARWLDRYQTLRVLYPLWTDLYRVSPEIALAPPSSSLTDALSLRDLNIRLYRRVVETRDGLLTLRQYVDSQVREDAGALARAAGLSGDNLEVVTEAATVAAAIQAKEQGHAMVEGDVVAAAPADADLTAEAAYLTRLSRAYRSSPVVRTMLDRTDHTAMGSGSARQGTRRP